MDRSFKEYWEVRKKECATWDVKSEELRHLHTWLNALFTRDSEVNQLEQKLAESEAMCARYRLALEAYKDSGLYVGINMPLRFVAKEALVRIDGKKE